MTNKKKLWLTFGPILVAALVVVLIFAFPLAPKKVSRQTQNEAASSLSLPIFKGNLIKKQALENNFVPFFGSSELSRIDAFHPSTMAVKYNRPYRPFLMGKPGAQSLSQLMAMQGLDDSLKGKKAVFIISPQWFTERGQRQEDFNFYRSPLGITTWMLSAQNNGADRYTAKRLLDMSKNEIDFAQQNILNKLAKGEKISTIDRSYLELKKNILHNEERIFASVIPANNLNRINTEKEKLPDQYSIPELEQRADMLAAKETNNNPFDIKNSFYNIRLRGRVGKELKGSQKDFNYERSIEYSDFQLLLNEFSRLDMNVLFIITPVNAKWSAYTGLSQDMYQRSTEKIKYQLSQQGFDNILDLSRDGNKRYFMEDTIHVGWRGWLKIDESVNPFLTKKQPQPKYQIQKRFYKEDWQQKNLPEYLNK